MKNLLVHNLFENIALEFPDNIAIEDSSKSINYAELNSSANRVAHFLLSNNYVDESIIGVLLDSSIELVRSMLAIFKSGNIYLPLNMRFSKKKLEEVLSITSCKTIITDNAHYYALKELFPKINDSVDRIIILEEQLFSYDSTNPSLPIKNDAGLYLTCTSGSTGESKSILGDQKGLSHFIQWEIKEFGIDETFRISQLSQLTFDSSLRDILVPLCSGGILCIPSQEVKNNIIQLINWIENSGINLIHCVPSLFRLIMKELHRYKTVGILFKSLKFLLMAGESIFSKDIMGWHKTVGRHVEIVNFYGPTESTLIKTFHRIKNFPLDASQAIHIGKPIDNTFIAIINDGKLCRIGEIGEIYIVSPYITKGYFNKPTLTKKVFVQNPLVSDRTEIVLKTGDYGRYLKTRDIEFLGRLDEQVKINGIRIELNEIRLAVMEIPEIDEVVVKTQKNHDNDEELICYYTGEFRAEDELRTLLKTNLNEQLIPEWFMFLDKFPLNINGKIDKKKLPKPDAMALSIVNYASPRNQVEQELEQIFADILGLHKVSRNISFFKMGGNSLKAILLISRIFRVCGRSIKIKDVFSYPTISELAVIINGSAKNSKNPISPINEQEYYEASHAQKRLWLLDHLQENLLAYNISMAYVLKGSLNTNILEKVFYDLQLRHEILRTTFEFIDGDVRQKIRPRDTSEFELKIIDLTKYEERNERARQLCVDEVTYNFILDTGPLFCISLLKLEEEKHLLLLKVHHIICDDWSLKVLTKEVFILYEAYCSGLSNPLPELSVQYKDFSAWQNKLLREGHLQVARRYWNQKFSDEVPTLKFPNDFSRPLIKTYSGALVDFQLDIGMNAKLEDFCQRHGITLFMLLLTTLYVLLNKYTGEKDITVGTPVMGRPDKGLEDQIGLYINVLPLRLKFKKDEPLTDVLKRTEQIALEAFEHQLYPFDSLIDDLQLSQDRSRSPLFDILLVLQNAEVGKSAVKGLTGISVTEYQLEVAASKYDMEFGFFENENGLKSYILYNNDLFMENRMRLLVERYNSLLSTIVENPKSSVAEIIDRTDNKFKKSDSDSFSWDMNF